MVRLKEHTVISNICRALISIPYGSIKRQYRNGLSLCYTISIPYGSIKSDNEFMQKMLSDSSKGALVQKVLVEIEKWFKSGVVEQIHCI